MVCLWIAIVGALSFSFIRRAERLRQMAADPVRLNWAAAAQDVHGAREELVTLRFELAPLLWLGARIGGDWGAAEPLMDTAVEAAIAADESAGALAPLLSDSPTPLSMTALPRILDSLVVARPALQRASVHLDAAAASLARVERPLSPRFESRMVQVDQLIDLARQGMRAALIAPELLGQGGPRTYLVLVQNSDELRPTGGFIASFGRIVVDHGALISQTFQDSYAADDFTKYYPDPPQPLFDYMSSEQWVFRDANWSPDFPTTARDAIRLYQIGRPEHVDGVIGINQKAIEMLLPGLEPLRVDGFAEPLTAANAERMFQAAWEIGLHEALRTRDPIAWNNRKQFVASVALASTDKLARSEVNWTRLGLGALEALRQRQLTIYAPGPEASQLRRFNWDGALRQSNGDYLMVVDSNVGFSKTNPLVSERVDYQVILYPEGTGRATVSLSYGLRGTRSGIVCAPMVAYTESLTYDDMVHRCFYDYLRLVVPRGSQLREATAHQTPGKYLLSGKDADGKAETLVDESGRAVFAQFFVVEYGQQLQTQLDYDLPRVVSDTGGIKRYALQLQKQSGTDGLPVKVMVTLPTRAQFIAASPRPSSRSGSSLEFDLTLDTDRQIEVKYVIAN